MTIFKDHLDGVTSRMKKFISKMLFKIAAKFREFAHKIDLSTCRAVLEFSKHPYKEKTMYLTFRNLTTQEITEQCAMPHEAIYDIVEKIKSGDL